DRGLQSSPPMHLSHTPTPHLPILPDHRSEASAFFTLVSAGPLFARQNSSIWSISWRNFSASALSTVCFTFEPALTACLKTSLICGFLASCFSGLYQSLQSTSMWCLASSARSSLTNRQRCLKTSSLDAWYFSRILRQDSASIRACSGS